MEYNNNLPSQHPLRGTFLVILSGLLYGGMAYFGVNLFQENLSVESMLFWRFFIAMLWMLAVVQLRKKPSVKTTTSKNKLQLFLMISLGAISYSASSGFYFLAVKQISTGSAMVIFFSYPVFVTLFSWLFSQWKLNKIAIISLIAVTIGLILLKGEGASVLNSSGILLAMVAALAYAIYVYRSRHNTHAIDSRWLTLFICMGNALIFLTIAIYTHTFTLPTTWSAWLNILAIGIIATALPIQLLLDGLKYISAIKASILSVFEPVVTVLVGLVLLDETMSAVQGLGVMVILAGAIMIQFERASE